MSNNTISDFHLESVKRVHELYLEGRIPQPPQHVVYPRFPSEATEKYVYFTLPCAINFQRNSPALWKSALETYLDDETRFLFNPDLITKSAPSTIREAMLKHKLALQQNKHPHIWTTIATTLAKRFESDPRRILALCDYSILETTALLKEEKADFPYLSGIKLCNYWLFILSRFASIQYKDPEELSIIPDTHIIQASIHLGLAPQGADSKTVDALWRPILKKLGIPAGEMHSALWLWSRNKFIPTIEKNRDNPHR